MPRKSDIIPINNENLDRRVKLTVADKLRIKELSEVYLQRYLAAMFNCSRRSIQFIIDPEKHAENLKRRAETGGSKQYYNREANTISMREHRNYKSKLYKDKLI